MSLSNIKLEIMKNKTKLFLNLEDINNPKIEITQKVCENDLKELIEVLEYHISKDNGIDWKEYDLPKQLKKYKSIIKKYK